MAAILAGTSTATTLVGDVFGLITSNALLCTFVALGLLGAAIGIFRKLKRGGVGHVPRTSFPSLEVFYV